MKKLLGSVKEFSFKKYHPKLGAQPEVSQRGTGEIPMTHSAHGTGASLTTDAVEATPADPDIQEAVDSMGPVVLYPGSTVPWSTLSLCMDFAVVA